MTAPLKGRWPFGPAYDPATWDRIAGEIGPCLPGQSCESMRWHIDEAACGYLAVRKDTETARGERDQLRDLAEALEEAWRRAAALGRRATIRLGLAAQEHGIKLPQSDYLADLTKVTRAAAGLSTVTKGPKTNEALARFIRDLAWYIDHFAGWRGKVTYTEIDDSYTGRFFKVVRLCLDSLPIEHPRMSDESLAQIIRRALTDK